MKIKVENEAGGGGYAARTLTGLAMYIRRNPVYLGYRIVSGSTPEAEAVVRWSSSSRESRPEKIVEDCLRMEGL